MDPIFIWCFIFYYYYLGICNFCVTMRALLSVCVWKNYILSSCVYVCLWLWIYVYMFLCVLCKCVGSFACSRSCSSFKLYILDAVHPETVVGRRTNRSLVSSVTITLINQAWVAADQTDWCPPTLTTSHKSKVITPLTILSFFCWPKTGRPTATHREFFLLFCDTSDEVYPSSVHDQPIIWFLFCSCLMELPFHELYVLNREKSRKNYIGLERSKGKIWLGNSRAKDSSLGRQVRERTRQKNIDF